MAAGRTLPALTLVIGGARSGKSRHAEALVEGEPGPCTFLATAQAGDSEMAERIRRHRARRGERWRTVEEPIALGPALARVSLDEGAVLVDCLTLWLSNLILAGHDPQSASEDLIASLAALRGPVVMVSNEVGCGIVPDNALARRFQDEAGRLNQAVAAAADRVVYMVAGLPMRLKPAP
jgi:adenosylcobinamide kinase/adenosylcobinamide-phosphate guanylyltransferase